MSQPPSDPGTPADDAPTPTDLIHTIRAERRAAMRAEARILELAVEWAHAHPDLDLNGELLWWQPGKKGTAYAEAVGAVLGEDGAPTREGHEDFEDYEWFAIPQIRWDAVAPFATANHMSTTAGKAFVRDALVLSMRLPGLYARVRAGAVPVWKARQVAQAALGRPEDVLAYLDTHYTPIAHTHGLITVEKTLDAAMLTLYPEQAEHDRLDALTHRKVDFNPHQDVSLTNGLAHMAITGDYLDLAEFDRTVSAVAAALKDTEAGEHESLDVRRSMAIGILAHPQDAQALLEQHEAAGGAPRRSLDLIIHLTTEALKGTDVVATDETGRVFLADQVAAWAGRPDTKITVRGLIDLTETHGPHDPDDFAPGTAQDPYAPSPTTRETVILRDKTCAFPFCRRRARTCDLDHICPYAETGRTCHCDLAPLCRHHHRLKTHAGWRYRPLEPGVYLWTEPHGQSFIRTRDGTTDLTPHDPPDQAA